MPPSPNDPNAQHPADLPAQDTRQDPVMPPTAEATSNNQPKTQAISLQPAVTEQLKADRPGVAPTTQAAALKTQPLTDAHGAPLPPKSNKRLIIGLIAGGLIVFGLIGYFGFSTLVGITKRISPSPTPSPSPSSTSKADDKLTGISSVAFEVPATIKEWKTEILSENGVTKYASADSRCQVTFAQNKKAEDTSELTTQGSLTSYIAAVRKQLKSQLTESSATAYSVQGIGVSDRRYEFIGSSLQYVGNDGVAYTNHIHARVIGDFQLYIIKACQSPAWESAQVNLQSVVDAVKLVVR